MLNVQLTLLVTIALGYGITKGGMISPKTRAELTNLVINVILPCSIFSSFQQGMSPEILRWGIVVLLVASGLQFLVFILNKFLFLWIPTEKRIILKYAMITNNSAFMGLPVLGGVIGELGILYGSIFLIPMRILMWTTGLSLFTASEASTASTGKRIVSVITNPNMIAVYLGIGFVFLPIQLPVFLMNAITTVGFCVRVVPMMIVGSLLSGVKFKEAFDIHSFYYSLFRLLVVPAIMLGALSLLKLDPVVVSVSVFMAGMPAANTTAVLAEKYGKEPEFASKTVLVSILLSMITLPLIAAVLI